MPAFDFDAVQAQATAAWSTELARVDFDASPAMKKNLYTALHHALLSPNLTMDVDGSYRGPDNEVHHASGFRFVSNLSLWDTFRAEQPLMTLIEPAMRTNDLVNSLLAFWRESPFWRPADLAGAGYRDVLHDRLPCCAGDSRRLHKRLSWLRRGRCVEVCCGERELWTLRKSCRVHAAGLRAGRSR